jgi:uncharacterized protein
MRLEHYPVETLKRQLISILERHINITQYEVFFFGSRVSGTSTERSDIDVGIRGPETVPLSKLGAIREELDHLPTLYTIDLIDFRAASEDFKAVALQQIEELI